MDKKLIVLSILNNINRDWTELIKKKHGKCPAIFLGDLILAILKAESGLHAAPLLNISPHTFDRTIKKAFPNDRATGSFSNNWYRILLRKSLYKECSMCKELKLRTQYNIDRITIDGLSYKCRDCISIVNKKSYKGNPGYYKDKAAKRNSAKLQRTPKWADLAAIKNIYNNCPEGFHVDHIVPLQGKIVSGLHVENNLQYLTAKENLAKGNKF